MIFPSIFAIVVGIGMIAMWTVSYLSKQIPELGTNCYGHAALDRYR